MRHSDEIAPARLGPVVWRAEPRVPSEAARRRGRCRAQGAGRQGDVTARMMDAPARGTDYGDDAIFPNLLEIPTDYAHANSAGHSDHYRLFMNPTRVG